MTGARLDVARATFDNTPRTPVEDTALAVARSHLERACWASLRGYSRIEVGGLVVFRLRGRAILDGKTLTFRVEVVVAPDGTVSAPKRVKRGDCKRARQRLGALGEMVAPA